MRSQDNPAAELKTLLPKRKRPLNHRPSLPYSEAPEALAAWQALPVNEAVRLAVLFIVLTTARLGEATGATWPEINLSERIWTVPAHRMKARREHKVPLSDQTVKLLKRAQELKLDESLVFGPLTGWCRP